MRRKMRTHLLLLSLVMAAAATPAASADVPDAASLSEGFARHLAKVINRYREQQGLPPLRLADELQRLAGEHSGAMAAQRRLSHDGFDARFDRTTSTLCIENVGWNYPTAETLLDGWRRSPGHHRNLLDPQVTRMGLGVDGPYVTWFACR